MNIIASCGSEPWNYGKLDGQKAPFRLRDIWAIQVWLQIAERTQYLALFDLAIDSKLRACDLTKLRVCDVAHGEAPKYIDLMSSAAIPKGFSPKNRWK